MTKSFQAVTLLAMLAIAGTAAASVTVSDRAHNEFAINVRGTVVIENPIGNIEVTGSDEAKVVITSERAIRAANDRAVEEARRLVNRIIEGNDKARAMRTSYPIPPNARWNVQVHYTVTMPRTANLKIISTQTNRIRVSDVRGQVVITNMNGPVVVDNVSGPVTVQNINGDIFMTAPRAVVAGARLSSTNGSIVVRAPADADFSWEAETVMGDARTAFPLRAPRFLSPARFRASINSPANNLTFVTESFSGNILMIPVGAEETTAKSIRTMARAFQSAPPPQSGVGPMLPSPAASRTDVQLALVRSNYRVERSMGNVRIDEIRGGARIVTGMGEVHLGTVFGHCDVISGGGPLSLGDIMGVLNARTDAGNVNVQRARTGGTIFTGGGTIQLQHAGGPMQLSSGGGDIVLRQAFGPVRAETSSGDIAVTFDGKMKSERVSAKTAKGNVVLTLPTGFGADVDAVVITSDPTANSIRSDFPGLSIQRDQVGGKTRIRATGKINGGGERVELHAQDGGIHIASNAPRVSPMIP